MNYESVLDEIFQNYQPIQSREELLAAMEIVEQYKPRVVVEIGTFRGGSLRAWQACSAADAVIVGTDTLGTPLEVENNLQSWLSFRQRGKIFLGDTHSESFRDQVMEFIDSSDSAPIDFLFHDGDHHYDSIQRDLELYLPCVKAGGLVGMHDISETTEDIQAPRAWSELKPLLSKWWEFIVYKDLVAKTGAYGIGIGIKK